MQSHAELDLTDAHDLGICVAMSRFFSANLVRLGRLAATLAGLGALSGCGAKGEKNSPVVDGQKFVVHTIDDQQQRLPFIALQAPADWQVSGGLNWQYQDVSNPVTAHAEVVNPAKPEAVYFFPTTGCYWLQGASARNRPGTRALGLINLAPMQPAEAMRQAVLKIYRPNIPGLQIVGTRELPGLAAMLKADPKQNRGIGVKVSYNENGVPIEEEFYALYYYVPIGYDGPQGHSVQLDWGLDKVHSFKAPQGTLDQHRDIYAYVVHSVQLNPAWADRSNSIRKSLNDQFNRNLAQGYASIQAAAQLSRQITANSDAFLASIDKQRAASNAASASARSSADKFDDYIRGVDTVNDPYTGTSQQTGTYHWTDGYGQYQNSNDANFDPNKNSSVTWTQMTPVN